MSENAVPGHAFYRGKLLYFRYPTEEDAVGDWHTWLNNVELAGLLGRMPWPNSPDEQIAYLRATRSSTDRLLLSIVDQATDKLIGIASLSQIDRFHQRAQTALMIGSCHHNDGRYALEALAILTEIGLVVQNLHRLDASALVKNTASHALNKVLGWREVGIRRQSHYLNGTFEDSVLHEMLREDWLSSAKRPTPLSVNSSCN